MNPLIASSLISTGGSLLGGMFGKKKKSFKNMRSEYEMQQEYTDKALKHKMAAAKKYKIHPLTMLGANTPTVTAPVYEGKENNMGQNIATSISDGASKYFTGKANKQMNDLALERAGLENELLKSQITSINNPSKAGGAYSNDSRVLNQTETINKNKVDLVKDENITRSSKDAGLTAGSDSPPPAGKKFTVGETPYGKVYITLPASGQADEYGELYGAIKGIEYLSKRGYVHYANGTAKAGKKLVQYLNLQKKPYSTSKPKKGYSKITW